MATADWANIAGDIVYMILDKLFDPIQHIRFAAVCKDWRRVSKTYNEITQRWRGNNKMIPMLMIPSPNAANSEQEIGTRLLYSVSDNRVVYNNIELKLPYLHDNSTIKCFGCHRDNGGWLATVDLIEGDRRHLNITLVNPFKKQLTPIRLPPLKFEGFEYEVEDRTSYRKKRWYPKVVLFGDPTTNPDGFAVVAIYSRKCANNDQLPFIRGQQSADWTYLQVCGAGRIGDAIFYKSKVYVIGTWGAIFSVDIASSEPTMLYLTENWTPLAGTPYCKMYLVESTKGDLFFVVKAMCVMMERHNLHTGPNITLWPPNIIRFTKGFSVYKVVCNDRDGSILEWVKVDSIGDEAFFVGDNHSFSVLASDFPNCQRNSIYYTEDFHAIYDFGKAPPDMGIFNLDDKSFTQLSSDLNLLVAPNNIRPAIWTIPPLNGL